MVRATPLTSGHKYVLMFALLFFRLRDGTTSSSGPSSFPLRSLSPSPPSSESVKPSLQPISRVRLTPNLLLQLLEHWNPYCRMDHHFHGLDLHSKCLWNSRFRRRRVRSLPPLKTTRPQPLTSAQLVFCRFWASCLKLLVVSMFVILGIVMCCGGGPASGEYGTYQGGKLWQDPGAFANGFKGVCAVFVTAAFSFAGTELVGLAASETPNPRKTMVRAVILYSSSDIPD